MKNLEKIKALNKHRKKLKNLVKTDMIESFKINYFKSIKDENTIHYSYKPKNTHKHIDLII